MSDAQAPTETEEQVATNETDADRVTLKKFNAVTIWSWDIGKIPRSLLFKKVFPAMLRHHCPVLPFCADGACLWTRYEKALFVRRQSL